MPNDPSPWLEVFGRAHPILLHSPLGLLPAIAVLEFGAALLRRPTPRGSIATLAWLCAFGALAAAASGWTLAGHGDYGDAIAMHKNLGLTLAGLCTLAAVLALLARRGPFRIVLLAALGTMVPAGHEGGSITHGRNFLFEPLQADSAPAVASGSTFERTIAPILARTCTKCHNPEKAKGELRLDSRDGILAGGENGAVLVPGQPDASPLLTRCELPIDHDDHMPPEGKPQPTTEELRTLREWIAAGAKFD
jgi:hypothetical protein